MATSSKVGQHPLLARTPSSTKVPVAKPKEKKLKTTVSASEDRYVKTGTREASRQVETTVTRANRHGKEGEIFSTKEKPSALNSLLSKLPQVKRSGSFSVSTQLISRQGSFKAMNGSLTGSYTAEFGKVNASGSGSLQISKGTFIAKGNLEAEASLVNAKGKVSLTKNGYGVDAEGQMFIGARANLDGSLVWNPKKGEIAARVNGEAFSGVKVSGNAQVKMGDYGSAGVNGELQAGLGASFKAEAAYKGGRFKARVELGLCLGVGFKLGFNVDINVKKIVDTVKAPFRAIANKVNQVTRVVTEKVNQVVNTVSNTVNRVANTVTNAVSNAVSSVGSFFRSLF